MKTPVHHEAILASAGSGKTYQLSNRIIRLLASGAPPASVLALTFTRKAAGEFSRRTLTKLAGAAANDTAARKLAGELGLSGWDAARFNRLLAETAHGLHRLRLGTLDSFYQNLARACFFELGLAGAFTLLDDKLALQARTRVLQQIFRRAGEEDAEAQRHFLEAFRQATWGREESGTLRLMDGFVDEALLWYQLFPDPESWGDPRRLWPERNCPWLPVPSVDEFQTALAALTVFAGRAGWAETRFGGSFGKFLVAARDWQPGVPLSALGSFFENTILPRSREVLTARDANGGISFSYYKKNHDFSPEGTAELAVALRHIIGGALARQLNVTAGVRALLQQYDGTYDRMVRRLGRLTFADTAGLLAGSGLRFDIGYRLDAEVRHWLFDEFQDTSRRDWSVVADNLDAVLSDATGERSAFFVGDVKQALYGWRGGDHALLSELCHRYGLEPRPMDVTYRSSPVVLELANAVFDRVGALRDVLPESVRKSWGAVWHHHTAAGAAAERPGHAVWYVCERDKNGTANTRRRLAALGGLLLRTNPLAHGLTCGVLVQKNEEARQVAAFLREQGLRVVSETDARIAEDNPVIPAVLAWLEHAAHPEDGYARGVVAMTPALAALTPAGGGKSRLREVLLDVGAGGFAAALEALARRLEEAVPRDDFSRRRWEQLLALAREFDETGSREIDSFTQFVRMATRRETSDAGSVQVMTVHKSKGLEFDVVYLPFLEGNRLDSARNATFIHAAPGDDTAPGWVLSAPDKAVCEMTPVLAENLAGRQSESCYEKLCLLYVALTRARHETVVLTTAPVTGKADADSGTNFGGLLEAALGTGARREVPFDALDFSVQLAWEAGSADWLSSLAEAHDTGTVAHPDTQPAPETLPERQVLPRRRPSQEEDGPTREVLSGRGLGREFGSCVHALLAEVPFVVEETHAEVLAKIAARAAELQRDFAEWICVRAAECVRAALTDGALKDVFSEPEPEAILWRERSFGVILDDALVSGVFDRVVIGKGWARIYDFKTDSVDVATLERRYAEQMAVYRRALAKLTGLPEDVIETRLVQVGSAGR